MHPPRDPPKPVMLAAERKALEELYRIQINSVRTLAGLLGYPNPIAPRGDRPVPAKPECAGEAEMPRS